MRLAQAQGDGPGIPGIQPDRVRDGLGLALVNERLTNVEWALPEHLLYLRALNFEVVLGISFQLCSIVAQTTSMKERPELLPHRTGQPEPARGPWPRRGPLLVSRCADGRAGVLG